MTIFFGSQTGTAEGYARVLQEEGRDAGFDAKMQDLEDFSPETLKDCKLAVFVMATYGEGDPTDNAARFVKWLKNDSKEVPENYLENLHYTVFGLGNKQYEHFNRVGKLTNALLEKLGGKRVVEYGQGDDDGTLEEDFEAWKSTLWPQLVEKYITSNGESSVRTSADAYHKVNLQFQLRSTQSNPIAPAAAAAVKNYLNSSKHFFTAPHVPVIVNRELRNIPTDGTGQGSTRHIDLDLVGSGLHYETADNLAVLPDNPAAIVSAVANRLGYQLDEVVTMEAIEGNADFKPAYPTPCTVRELLTSYLDLQGELKTGVLRALVSYLTDATQRHWLENMLHSDHRAELKNLLRLRDFSDLLANELSSLQIPLVDLLHVLPAIQPRYYTISSSALAQPTTVSVTVSLSQITNPRGKAFTGLCSGYLCGLTAGKDRVRVFVRASTFRLPKSISTPLILVGPGTGIAPMHAFLQERKHLLNTRPELRSQAGPIALFFGCRYSEVDFIYKQELQEMVRDGVLTNLFLAFSRDASASHDNSPLDAPLVARSKVYVQNLLQDSLVAKRVLDWLNIPSDGHVLDGETGAYVYVCGATNMGHDVMAAIQKVLTDASLPEAQEIVKSLHDKGRYVQELWSA